MNSSEQKPAAPAPIRRGLMLILSSPSGAGKTTLTRNLLQSPGLDLTLSISVTTRARRSSEVDGIHYSFIQRAQFERMRDAGDLLEWAEVHGNFYGTPRGPVEAVLAQGRDVLFDIDSYEPLPVYKPAATRKQIEKALDMLMACLLYTSDAADE